MRVIVTEDCVEVRLALWQKLLGLMRDIRLPRADGGEVHVVDDPIGPALQSGIKVGLRLPWLYYLARTIRRELNLPLPPGEGRGEGARKPFHFKDKGQMATIGRSRAIVEIGRLKLAGFPAWVLWLVVHIYYLTGFKNRVTALLHWAVSFVGRGRSERTSTEKQIFGRTALKRLERGAADLVSGPGEYDASAFRRAFSIDSR